jgi:hypothetical protein
MSNSADMNSVRPWYRQPWPWLLMLGPAVVIVASVMTAWIAYSTSDGLVTEDYYKKGLAVNQTLARSQVAATQGLRFQVRLTDQVMEARLAATKNESFVYPTRLKVTLSHPTRAGLDRQFVLDRSGDRYLGEFRLPVSGHWLILVEDEAASWRLMGNIVLPINGELTIGEQ